MQSISLRGTAVGAMATGRLSWSWIRQSLGLFSAMPSPSVWPDQVSVDLDLDVSEDDDGLRAAVARRLHVSAELLPPIVRRKRSFDARGGRVRIHWTLGLGAKPSAAAVPEPRQVETSNRVIIVGDGPAGLFCAFELARRGIGAIVIDRGKTVQPRRHDLKGLHQRGRVDPNSNYCFGEGGAGTYSDGKLYTRAHKRGSVQDVLDILVRHGAPPDIAVDARPHIGSNRLPKVVTSIRESLEACGTEFVFGARVVELLAESHATGRRVAGVCLHGGQQLVGRRVVVATGHSARDVFELLARAGIALEAKPFALGVRIEHPQPLINRIQYGRSAGHPKLPSAPYQLTTNVEGRGVFSFCMCPGGFIVPATTEPEAVVVNGMSLSRRDSPFANSGLVVSIELEDLRRAGFEGPLAGVEFQRRIERAACGAGGGAVKAPGTRLTDFLRRSGSSTLPTSSYVPGLTATDLGEVLDGSGIEIAPSIRAALSRFGKGMQGFITDESVLVGVESRTSSPVRVPRHPQTLQSPDLAGLYPAGEGAGHAGGIMSAALDGIAVARAIAEAQGHST